MAKQMIPNERPKISRTEIEDLLKAQNFDLTKHKICIVGIRGYYKKSMGDPLKNDIGIYDDAVAVISQTEFATFNYNTDPSAEAFGRATLAPGLYFAHCLDLHRGDYLAVCQRHGNVVVTRFGKGGVFTGSFGINVHRGGLNDTWSEGCQTVPSRQYTEFIDLVCKIVDTNLKKGQSRYNFIIPYLLKQN
jgi:lysozyme